LPFLEAANWLQPHGISYKESAGVGESFITPSAQLKTAGTGASAGFRALAVAFAYLVDLVFQ